ncbi:MAG: DUF2164 domain-containing protein [Gammaproteobacteria bacterium]|jgi:uncharacterized protein (DUF2164 family)
MIKFSEENKKEIIAKIKNYFHDELNQEIGGFDAEFLLDFFAKEIGGYFYNQALTDVHVLLEKQTETLVDTIYALEQPVSSGK